MANDMQSMAKEYGLWLKGLVTDSEHMGINEIVLMTGDVEVIINMLLKIGNGDVSQPRLQSIRREQIFHCIACGVEVGREDLENGHTCEKCRVDEWKDRRQFSNLITQRRDSGRPLSDREFSEIEGKITAKYSKFAYMDKLP